MVADININEVTKKHAVPLSKVSNGTSASCQGSKTAQICGRDTQLQTHIGAYTLYRLLWPGRSYIPWTMWLCSEEHTIAKLFEEL